MNDTPTALRTQVAIVGRVNAGKSTLFNLLLGQDAAIVSSQPGTTTDPVGKNMELTPFGAVTLTDTAGLGDSSALGAAREARATRLLDRADFAVYVADAAAFDGAHYALLCKAFAHKKIPHLLVFMKTDLLGEAENASLRRAHKDALLLGGGGKNAALKARARLSAELGRLAEDDHAGIGKYVPPGGVAVMVCPIDSQAPKGRLILPQAQLIRDCLDNNVACMAVRETGLAQQLAALPRIDLVVTDSQVFKQVADLVPPSIPLTSFSMLLASRFGNIQTFADGARALDALPEGARILFAEACTHNYTHEDIGRVKIPAMIRKSTGRQFLLDYAVGYDFPANLGGYSLVVHCGGCMINGKALRARVERCREERVPITNYGVLIAHMSGVLERAGAIFSI